MGAYQHHPSTKIRQTRIARLRRRVEPPIQHREGNVDRTRDDARFTSQVLTACIDQQRTLLQCSLGSDGVEAVQAASCRFEKLADRLAIGHRA